MMKPTIFFALLCAFAVAFALGGEAAVLSAAAGLLAVLPPQLLLFTQMRRAAPATAFSLWAGKFALTILLVAVFARALHELSLLSAGFFVLGAAGGVGANVAMLVRRGRV